MRILITVLFAIGCLSGLAQEGVLTFGVQFRPLVPNRFVDFSDLVVEGEGMNGVWSPELSLNFGGVVRYGITRAISIESGINVIRRRYTVFAVADDLGLNEGVVNRFDGYEIPIQALYYVRLGDKLWMNASGGISLDMYPSNTFSTAQAQRDTTFYQIEQFTARRSWLQIAVQANYGFEYRTKESGYFYLGASYHQPFSAMAISESVIRWDGGVRRSITALSGAYFTFDFRYFFHEDPDRRPKR
jgi:hypothetical protein